MYLKHKEYLKFRRILLMSTFLVMALVTSVSAQFSFGAQTGVNLNQFTMPGTSIGISAGGYASYKFKPFLSGRIEILYSQEGGGRQDYSLPLSDPSLADIAVNLRSLNYINPYVYMHTLSVPLMVELTLPEFAEADVAPKLLLGGTYGYMFDAIEYHTKQFIFTDGTFGNVPYLSEDVASNYAASQFSVLAGLGVEVRGEKRNFSFDIRYRQGLTQLNTVTQSYSYKDGRLFSSTLSFNFSMSISTNK